MGKYKYIILLLFFSTYFVSINAFAHEALVKRATNTFGVEPKGIIHIGAADGEELSFYKDFQVKNVLWIEADLETYKKLVANIDKNSNISTLDKIYTYFESGQTLEPISNLTENFAVSDKNGSADFFRTNNAQSSSLLELKLHKTLHPHVVYRDKISVNTKRLDTYFEESSADIKNYNYIVIDIQGAELMALKGAVNALKSIDCVISEVNYDELYDGAVKIDDLDSFFLSHEFIRADTISSASGWGDALYIKKDLIRKAIIDQKKERPKKLHLLKRFRNHIYSFFTK